MMSLIGRILSLWKKPPSPPLHFKGIAATTDVDRQGEMISLQALENMSKAREIGMFSGHWRPHQKRIGHVTKIWVDGDALHVKGVLDANLPDVRRIEKVLHRDEKLALSVGGVIRQAHYESVGKADKIRVIDVAKLDHIVICHSNQSINPMTHMNIEEEEAK